MPDASVAALHGDMERKEEVTSVMQQPAALLLLIDRMPLYDPALVLGVRPAVSLMLTLLLVEAAVGGGRCRSNDTCLALPASISGGPSRERMSLTATARLAPRSSSSSHIIIIWLLRVVCELVVMLSNFWPHLVVGVSAAAAAKEQSTLSMLVSFLWQPGREAAEAAAVLPRPRAVVVVAATAASAPPSRLMTLSVPRWGRL